MSNEIQLSVSLACTKLTSETAAVARQQLNVLRNMVGNFNVLSQVQLTSGASQGSSNVSTGASNALLIPLGGLSPNTNGSSFGGTGIGVAGSPHFGWFANLGSGAASDIVRIMDGNQSSAVIAELMVGDFCCIPLWGGCKPYVIATGSNQCVLEYFINGY